MGYYRDTAYEEWSEKLSATEPYVLCTCGELVDFEDGQPTWCPTCKDECEIDMSPRGDMEAIYRAIQRREDEHRTEAMISRLDWRDDADIDF